MVDYLNTDFDIQNNTDQLKRITTLPEDMERSPRYILNRKTKLQNKAYKIISFCFKDTKTKTKTKTQKLCISTDIGSKCSKYIQYEKKEPNSSYI